MKLIIENIKGDRTLWAVLILLAVFSFLPVYSAASNLAYISESGNTFGFLFKHFVHLSIGFCFIYFVQNIPYHYFRGISILMIPVVVFILLYTLFIHYMLHVICYPRCFASPATVPVKKCESYR